VTTYNRRTDPKVIGGKTRRANNNWRRTLARPSLGPQEIFVERRKPGKGHKHVVNRRQVTAFLELLPDWNEISQGLQGVILDEGGGGREGWHRPGTVGLCAWPEDTFVLVDESYQLTHREILAMLGVDIEQTGYQWLLKYTPAQATAFTLMHVLLHELGHHHDRMTTRWQASSSRGESYAEQYANTYAPTIWDRYQETFGW